MNDRSYVFHYRNLDSAENYALRALKLSSDYSSGRAEAYNNLAFVCMSRMDYSLAAKLLDSVALVTDNQLELLVSDVQNMRLCQRTSRNKEFYDYNERARQKLKRIEEERQMLSERLQQRFIYAKSEYAIVRSTYYYYVGLQKFSIGAIDSISVPEVQRDTAQYLSYLYQIGSGGIITGKNTFETCQREFETLLKCYLLAIRGGYVYWEANSLQSLSEHLTDGEQRLWLNTNNPVAMKYINRDDMPDTLVAGYLAQKALNLFSSYGDKYQTAGAYRTLASCYWAIGDYTSSLICLQNALADKRIAQAPDLVSSIREQLSLTYSALNDKVGSDRNRNLYLDMQERTRQDRQLEARAEQLERTSTQLNILAAIIIILLIIVTGLSITLSIMRRRKNRNMYVDNLLLPLRKWEKLNEHNFKDMADKREQIEESLAISRLHIEKNKKRNAENRAKIFLANSVMPFIDRIINETQRMTDATEAEERRHERMEYITELTRRITEYNTVLTSWIQLQKGELGVKIESFPLQSVFDILAKSSVAFRMKGLTLCVEPTDAVVKADRTLTLFMLNTLADNSRKFTDKGGKVKISAAENDNYVEVSVEDNGCGMSEAELAGIFNRSLAGGHGFGLQNCRGIIEKYKKVSRMFSVCGLFVDSHKGIGSRFYFRLPYGVVHLLVLFLTFSSITVSAAFYNKPVENGIGLQTSDSLKDCAAAEADSAYYSNVNGDYAYALRHVERSIDYLNNDFRRKYPNKKSKMAFMDNGDDIPAEIEWCRSSLNMDFNIMLDIRNEAAVAALALHKWDLYRYNNKVYTQLFKLTSADNNLAEYCRTMQRSSSNKAIAVAVLVLLLAAAVVSYYLLYYRHVLYFRFCADNINRLNDILLTRTDDEEKLRAIIRTDTSKYPDALRNIVDTIRTALQRSVNENSRNQTSLELAADELRRAEYEDAQLYVCNNVTDNCLSALKHETMYYPSRISQLVNSPDCDVHALGEVARYYRELCTILNSQAVNISRGIKFDCHSVNIKLTDGNNVFIKGDEVLLHYLLDIFRKENNGTSASITLARRDANYVILIAALNTVRITVAECADLFTPAVKNIPYLICRQIVRDMGEATNLHGCGIVAAEAENRLCFTLTLPGA